MTEEEQKHIHFFERIKTDFENDECIPCKHGVLLHIAKEVCKKSDIIIPPKHCQRFYEKVVLEEISIEEYLKKMKGATRLDKAANAVINALIQFYETTPQKED